MTCQSISKFVTIVAISKIPLILCSVNVLTSDIPSQNLCPNKDSIVLNNTCYLRTNVKSDFNESLALCEDYEMSLLTNQNKFGYERILELENVNKIGRRVVWIGAQMRLRNKWFWVKNRTQEW